MHNRCFKQQQTNDEIFTKNQTEACAENKFRNLNNYQLTIHYLDVSKDIRWNKVMKRNGEKGETFEFEVSKENFDFMENWFEKPTEEEMIGGIIIKE